MDPARRSPHREHEHEPDEPVTFNLQAHPGLERIRLLTDALGASMFRISATKLNLLDELAKAPRTALELSDILGVHRSAVHRHLNALLRADLVERSKAHRGAYELAPLGQRVVKGR